MRININMLTAVAVLSVMAVTAFAQPFTLPKLPYAYTALEPHIDAKTMEIHHSRHHQGYVTNLNTAVANTPAATMELADMLIAAGRRGAAVRNNGGGHYNHTMFWELLSPTAKPAPTGDLMAAIQKQFGGLDSLKVLLNKAGATRFGSGWAWLVLTPSKQLAVTSTANQDNPIMDVAEVRGIPLLGIDVWEHAYYLQYQNKRGDYLGAIWKVLDWGKVEQNYASALTSPLLLKIEKDSWGALNEFHKVMSQTFHPMEKGDLKPIRERSAEMTARAVALQKSLIPASFDKPDIRKAIDDLVSGSARLDKAVKKKKKDALIVKELTALHDTFHVIQGLCMD